jgi:hypothetical protein
MVMEKQWYSALADFRSIVMCCTVVISAAFVALVMWSLSFGAAEVSGLGPAVAATDMSKALPISS